MSREDIIAIKDEILNNEQLVVENIKQWVAVVIILSKFLLLEFQILNQY